MLLHSFCAVAVAVAVAAAVAAIVVAIIFKPHVEFCLYRFESFFYWTEKKKQKQKKNSKLEFCLCCCCYFISLEFLLLFRCASFSYDEQQQQQRLLLTFLPHNIISLYVFIIHRVSIILSVLCILCVFDLDSCWVCLRSSSSQFWYLFWSNKFASLPTSHSLHQSTYFPFLSSILHLILSSRLRSS